MTVAEKIRYLRMVEGHLRGLNRELTQKEVVAAVKGELNGTISQPYLSQLESGRRRHLTNTSRLLLSRFFRVHPGYLVDDPEGFQTELITDFRDEEDQIDVWLAQGADRFRRDGPLAEALLRVARHGNTRGCLVLLGRIVDTPNLLERLGAALDPEEVGNRELEGNELE